MKNLSVVLNVVLLAAVGYLYYYNFSGSKNTNPASPNVNTIKVNDSTLNQPRIAYVELDSLNENIVFFKQKRKQLEAEQKQYEAEILKDTKTLETKQNIFFQKNPNATPEEVQNFRAQLTPEIQALEDKKQKQSQALNQKSFDVMEKIQKNLKALLLDYNKKKKYQYILSTGSGLEYLIYKDSALNITKDLIKEMNEKMKPDSQ